MRSERTGSQAAKPSPHAHGRSETRERPQLREALRETQGALGERLRALRDALELSQEEAAERIGIHAKHLQRMEGGSANVTLSTLVAVAVAYDVHVRDLLP